jgi:electron transport complex protein RnfB
VDADLCIGCEDCVERCQFGALAVPEDICEVDYARCVGCGVCATVCPTDALHLERRPEGETPPLPADNDEWLSWRAEKRGIRLEEVL